MSFETDFDSAFTIILGKAVGAITPTGTIPVSTGGSVVTAPVTAGIDYVIDGGGAAITNGTAGGLIVPFACEITKVELQEFNGLTGSITVDIRVAFAGSSPTFTSITSGSTPAISGGRYYSDGTLSGWSTSIARGQGLQYVVSGAATFTRITVALTVRRTDIVGIVG